MYVILSIVCMYFMYVFYVLILCTYFMYVICYVCIVWCLHVCITQYIHIMQHAESRDCMDGWIGQVVCVLSTPIHIIRHKLKFHINM